MGTEITTTTATIATMAVPEHKYEPTDAESAWKLAKLLFNSGLLPRHISSPEGAFTMMVAGAELGLTSMQAIRSLKMVDGNITMPAELMVARVKTRCPDCVYFQLIETTGAVATYETQRKGEPKPVRMSFTIEEARQAELTGKANWKRYPAAMLRARATSSLCRAVYPETVLGIYESTSDERDTEKSATSAVQTVTFPQRATIEPPKAAPSFIPDAEQVEKDPAVAVQLAARIDAAVSLEELTAIGKAIADAGAKKDLSQREIFDLKGAYRARQTSLKKAPKVDEFAEATREDLHYAQAMREPGEEG